MTDPKFTKGQKVTVTLTGTVDHAYRVRDHWAYVVLLERNANGRSITAGEGLVEAVEDGA